MPVFSENESFHFHLIMGQTPPKNWSFFVIFGCGVSDLKDGWTEFNETFTHCVICSQHDAHFFQNVKIPIFYQIMPRPVGNIVAL